jgi:hypothetical protein
MNGSTSGFVELDCQATGGNNNIKLPSSNGSANQFLKNGSTAGTLGWSSLVEDSSGNVNIDSGTFYVDATNNRVAIGTLSPSGPLHVGNPSDTNQAVVFSFPNSSTAFINCSRLSGGATQSLRVAAQDQFEIYTNGTERLRIESGGRVLIATATNNPAFNNVQGGQFGALVEASNDDISGRFNRRTTDGTIIEFRQDGTLEGSISVSGTTVSYNGAHLSRWSQLPGGTERTEILRGTVLSNIDEMCNWGDEENEQLNRMKVSDVEGDPNVAGVFQAWDDDDDTYTDDFYCAMTGDFIIRIAAGVPVHRGQLLMSAGDGTAIPQDDDIVRSKTVAKVTSHHVTCTYEDGSYCVPCVLMAC